MRQDGRRSPGEVLSWVSGMRFHPEDLARSATRIDRLPKSQDLRRCFSAWRQPRFAVFVTRFVVKSMTRRVAGRGADVIFTSRNSKADAYALVAEWKGRAAAPPPYDWTWATPARWASLPRRYTTHSLQASRSSKGSRNTSLTTVPSSVCGTPGNRAPTQRTPPGCPRSRTSASGNELPGAPPAEALAVPARVLRSAACRASPTPARIHVKGLPTRPHARSGPIRPPEEGNGVAFAIHA